MDYNPARVALVVKELLYNAGFHASIREYYSALDSGEVMVRDAIRNTLLPVKRHVFVVCGDCVFDILHRTHVEYYQTYIDELYRDNLKSEFV